MRWFVNQESQSEIFSLWELGKKARAWRAGVIFQLQSEGQIGYFEY